MKRIICLIAGIIFLVLGIIGLIFPIIPQVPFLIVALICFAGFSKRLKKKIISGSFYKKHLKSHVEKHKFLADILEN